MKIMIIRNYSEFAKLDTFMDRFEYLKLSGSVGVETFGFDRYLNQEFYQRSQEWKRIRDYVIIRDNGCDLGIEGHEIYGKILVHHMNPISKYDLLNQTKYLLDPEYLICTIKSTHDAIHYGDEKLLMKDPIERKQNDTCPWRK